MKEFFTIGDAVELIEAFQPGNDGAGAKSRELTLQLLQETESPFSRKQYKPGHVTSTALVVHPTSPRILLMYHRRLKRWLLPGGHIEKSDGSLVAAAAREAREETAVDLAKQAEPVLAGIDVHGIPRRKGEPFHLHHDLIWFFRAGRDRIQKTEEAREVRWAEEPEWDSLNLASSIRTSALRFVK